MSNRHDTVQRIALDTPATNNREQVRELNPFHRSPRFKRKTRHVRGSFSGWLKNTDTNSSSLSLSLFLPFSSSFQPLTLVKKKHPLLTAAGIQGCLCRSQRRRAISQKSDTRWESSREMTSLGGKVSPIKEMRFHRRRALSSYLLRNSAPRPLLTASAPPCFNVSPVNSSPPTPLPVLPYFFNTPYFFFSFFFLYLPLCFLFSCQGEKPRAGLNTRVNPIRCKCFRAPCHLHLSLVDDSTRVFESSARLWTGIAHMCRRHRVFWNEWLYMKGKKKKKREWKNEILSFMKKVVRFIDE